MRDGQAGGLELATLLVELGADVNKLGQRDRPLTRTTEGSLNSSVSSLISQPMGDRLDHAYTTAEP